MCLVLSISGATDEASQLNARCGGVFRAASFDRTEAVVVQKRCRQCLLCVVCPCPVTRGELGVSVHGFPILISTINTFRQI